MKIRESTLTEEAFSRHDYRDALVITVNGKEAFFVSDGEPEDASLGRNFNDCYKIVGLMKQAHKAGKNGEPFDFKARSVDEDTMFDR